SPRRGPERARTRAVRGRHAAALADAFTGGLGVRGGLHGRPSGLGPVRGLLAAVAVRCLAPGVARLLPGTARAALPVLATGLRFATLPALASAFPRTVGAARQRLRFVAVAEAGRAPPVPGWFRGIGRGLDVMFACPGPALLGRHAAAGRPALLGRAATTGV